MNEQRKECIKQKNFFLYIIKILKYLKLITYMRCVFGKSRIYVKIVIKKNLGNIHKSKAAETLVTDTDNKMCMPLLCQQSKQQPHEHGHISLPFTSSQFTPR